MLFINIILPTIVLSLIKDKKLTNLQSLIKIMLLAVAILALFLVAYFVNKYYIKPLKLRKHYLSTFKKLGYKVYELPFKPFGAPIYESHAYYSREKKDALYGSKYVYQGYDIVLGNILNLPNLLFINFKLAQQINQVDKINVLPKYEDPLRMLKYCFGEGLVFVEGNQWKGRRKILSKTFNFDFLKTLVPLISKFFNDYFAQLEKSQFNKGDNKYELELFTMGNKIFSMVVVGGFVGMDDIKQKINGMEIYDLALQAATLATEISRDPLTLTLGVKCYKLGLLEKHRQLEIKLRLLKGFFHLKLDKIRKEYENMTVEEKSKSKNLVHLLLYQAQLEKQALTDNSILDEILVFMIGGTETTATLFCTYVLEIFKRKEVEQKVRKQIKEHIKNEQDLNFDNLKNLKYMDWVQYETMRLVSGGQGIFDRIATADTMIGDIPICKGTTVNYINRTCFYDDAYFENAKEFRPERWENPTQDQLNMLMMGFSLGPRTCIGKHLALLESKIAAIKFVQRYENLTEHFEPEFLFTFAYRLKNSTVRFNARKQVE